ncbi:MAG: sugar ABC transporter substrate-binding protein, partial [Chloroflexota bacterium]
TQTAEVSFAFAGDTAELAAYQTLIDAFEASHPNIQIEVRHAPSRQHFQQKLVTMIDAGDPPDVVLLNYRRMAHFAADDDLVPLTPYMADIDLDPAEFYPIALEAFTWEGELWCAPQNISSLVVYYNQELFDAAEIPYPEANWDWDDFLEAAQNLANSDVKGMGLDPGLYRLAPFVWQANGSLFDGAKLLPDSAGNLEALTWFIQLQTVHQVVPDALESRSLSAEERFTGGEMAMIFESRRFTPIMRNVADFRWDVALLPQGKQSAGILHSDGYCLGKEPSAETLAFVRFALSEEGQTILAQTGRTVPSRMRIANSSAFLNENQPPANSDIWLESVPSLRIVPLHPNWLQLEEMASAEIEEAFYGRISPNEAIVRIQKNSENILP